MTTPCTQAATIGEQGKKLDQILQKVDSIEKSLMGSLSQPDKPGIVGQVQSIIAWRSDVDARMRKGNDRVASVIGSVVASLVTAVILAAAASATINHTAQVARQTQQEPSNAAR